MSRPFRFKQFIVRQDRCAMKVGTDGVLLGAWASLEEEPNSVLDIGAGTGIISMMMAQRCRAETIDALEIDGNAYEQCVENFEASPWADRLFCYHAGLLEFALEIEDKYDLIVSNPPFYSEGFASGNTSRDTARQSRSLPFNELLDSASKLLSSEGVLSIIVPFKEEEHLITLASKNNLFLNRIMRVKGNPSSEIKRSLLEFGFDKKETKIDTLIIEYERHRYTTEYITLTQDFYLKM
ncbi:tRNA1(Val) (adenine(37)-N6)-methyltransferase [Maribacter algicola]|uniref:tRNA1(Val) (Adenine(37)-N6)-methyltransferase n=1 Tax=Meishania litoralis TaxID=3434685 RepID=A0ACC7LG13_9FLAO